MSPRRRSPRSTAVVEGSWCSSDHHRRWLSGTASLRLCIMGCRARVLWMTADSIDRSTPMASSADTDTATPPRTTVRIPTASGDEIEAWVYRPDGEGPHPAIVMAHGFAAVKAGGLAPFAERFCREGFTAIAFDYRQWGGSSGQPRDEVSVPRQREDYRTVIDWALAHPDIDATRVFIWGTSFSGLHAIETAATDTRLRGAIAQNPLVDGLAGTRTAPP